MFSLRRAVFALCFALFTLTQWFSCALPAESADVVALRVGCSASWPPFTFLDSKGNLTGFDVDIRQELETRLGLPLEPRVLPFAELIPSLLAGEIDMILSSMSNTPERAQQVAFSRSYYISPPEAFVVRNNDESIATLSDLRGKVISCTAGSTHCAWLESAKIELGIGGIRSRTSNDDALRDVLAHRADVAYTDGNTVRKLQHEGTLALKLAFRHQALARDFICIAVRKEDSELLQRINQEIASMEEDDTLQTLRLKYDLE